MGRALSRTGHRDLGLAVMVISGLATGCATVISPPHGVADPVRVFVADYGYHSSLVLPRDSSRLSEFAFGQWEWFVLNHDHWYRAVPTLLVPQKGALGTRSLRASDDIHRVARQLGAMELVDVCVERRKVDMLLAELDQRFDVPTDQRVYNSANQMQFVADLPYSGARQCNHRVNQWLRQLGCEVRDGAGVAAFKVRTSGCTERP